MIADSRNSWVSEARNIDCPFCSERHNPANNKCNILCRVCQKKHVFDQMIGGICPLVFSQAKSVLKETSPECPQCLGEGTYEIRIVETYLESE